MIEVRNLTKRYGEKVAVDDHGADPQEVHVQVGCEGDSRRIEDVRGTPTIVALRTRTAASSISLREG